MNNKRKLNIFVHEKVNANTVRGFLLAIPLIVLFIYKVTSGDFSFDSMLDVSILVSFVFIFLCEQIAGFIVRIVEKNTEDATKVTNDYKSVMDKYSLEKYRMVHVGETYYPSVIDYQRKKGESLSLKIENSDNYYSLPKQVADHSAELIKAHKQSVIYNNITMRLDDLTVDNSTVCMKCSFTTYFDTMLTNRAIDYPFSGNRTIREVYEPGPFIHSLAKSKMSNHIGFNGFVRLKDDKFIFVRRSKKVSTAKNKWETSISASLKTKYVLNEDREMTIEGLANGIGGEIADELKIRDIQPHVLEDSIIGFYRDLVEGGKPHFVFYCECDLSSTEFEKHFMDEMRKSQVDKNDVVIDGSAFMYVTLEELMQAQYEVDRIKINGVEYPMDQSYISSVAILLNYLK